MRKIRTSESKLWQMINSSVMTDENMRDLSCFRSGKLNFRIALWNPQTNGIRYLKALAYNLAASLTEKQWKKMGRVKNRNVGKPIAIKYNGREVCLDYLQALYELEFIEKNMRLEGARVLEIGAGYGRTAHALISNHNIKEYTIVDLGNCLSLSRAYLKKVLDKRQYAKLRFILASDFGCLDGERFDLALNINSFAEMDKEVARFYLDFIDKHSRYFYVKNPVGKYLDKALDGHAQGREAVNAALKAGLLLDIIDIHDSKAVSRQSNKFLKAYKPGASWRCAAGSWAKPWSFYWNAFFAKQ